GLIAVAFVPAVSGLTGAVGPDATTDAYRTAMVVVAGLALAAAAVSAVGLRAPRQRSSAREVICPVDGTPLQPDPVACPPVTRPCPCSALRGAGASTSSWAGQAPGASAAVSQNGAQVGRASGSIAVVSASVPSLTPAPTSGRRRASTMYQRRNRR